jgi:predicted dehydrogenase
MGDVEAIQQFRVGLVGLGQQTCRRHLPALYALGILPAVVYDPDPASVSGFLAKFKALWPDRTAPQTASDLSELARNADVVVVVVPPCGHLSIFGELIAVRRPFLCEKPFTCSWPEAVHVATQATSAGVEGRYLENWIFDPVVLDIRSLLASGRVGLLQRLCITFPNAGLALYPDQTPWRAEAAQGGALLDWASHAVGLAWHMVGHDSTLLRARAIDVRCTQRRMLISGSFRDTDIEDAARFELAFECGDGRIVLVNVDGSWQTPWMWSPGHACRVLRADASDGAAEVLVTNGVDGRRYTLAIEAGTSPRQEIDLGDLRRFDPTASAIRNALQSIIYKSAPHGESGLDLAVNVHLALGAVRLSAARSLALTPDEFKTWLAPLLAVGGSPGDAWQKARTSLLRQV